MFFQFQDLDNVFMFLVRHIRCTHVQQRANTCRPKFRVLKVWYHVRTYKLGDGMKRHIRCTWTRQRATTPKKEEKQACRLVACSQQGTGIFIRAKRVSSWYIPKKKSVRLPCARVYACSTNLRSSVWYYVPHTYVPRISSLSAGYQDTYM